MTQTAIQTHVQALYQNVLQRAGDSGGLAYWAEKAEQGMSSMSMAAGFIGSSEAQNITALLHLYDVFFDRAADSAGLAFWVKALGNGVSLREIALGFAGSNEFQAKYGALSTAAYVEALYGNLFERAGDAAGKAYWSDAIDSGRVSRAEAALSFTLSDEAKASDGAAARFAESYLALRSSGVAEPDTAAVEALAHKSLAEAILELQTVHGTVQNGIIKDAHVSRDGDADGHPDAGANNVSTDANGNFTIVGGYGDIVVTGGTDLTTGKTNDKTLAAPGAGGAVMVTPLTTLIKAIVDQGVSVADAVRKVNLALGLDADLNPLTFNHTASATDSGATVAQQKEAIAVKGAIAQITTLMENVSGLIKGAAGAATDLDVGGISAAVAHALAGQIIAATASGNTGSPLLALASSDVIKATIGAAASAASADSATPLGSAVLAKIGELSADAAKVIGALNTVIGATVAAVNGAATFDPGKIVDAFSTIAKTEALGQDTIQAAITAGAQAGSLAGAAASYTGAGLNTAIKAQEIGAIADGVASTAGGSVITEVTGTATAPPSSGGGSSAATFTVTENATTHVVTFGGSATGAVTLSTTSGSLSFARAGVTATTKPLLADVADGGIPAVTMDEVAFLTSGLSAKLAASAATINATGIGASDLHLLASHADKIANGGLSGALALDESLFYTLSSKLAAGAAATVDATDVGTGTYLGSIVSNATKIANGGLSGGLTLNEDQFVALASKLAVGAAASVDASGATSTELGTIASNKAKIADGGLNNATLNEDQFVSLLSQVASGGASVDATGATGTELTTILGNTAKIADGGLSGDLALDAGQFYSLSSKLAAGESTVDATGGGGVNGTYMSAIVDNHTKIADGALSNASVTGTQFATLLDQLASDATTTVDATGTSATDLGVILANHTKIADGGLSDVSVTGAQFVTLLNQLGSGGASIDATGASGTELTTILGNTSKIAPGGLSNLALSDTAFAAVTGDAQATLDNLLTDGGLTVTGGDTGTTIDAGAYTKDMSLSGGSGADAITGGRGDDTITGGSGGGDTLTSGGGSDQLTGSLDADTFVISVDFGANGVTIADFHSGDGDGVQIKSDAWLSAGNLNLNDALTGASAYTAVAAAHLPLHSFNVLFFDNDGSDQGLYLLQGSVYQNTSTTNTGLGPIPHTFTSTSFSQTRLVITGNNTITAADITLI